MAAESEVEALESTPFDRAATKKRLEVKRRADNQIQTTGEYTDPVNQ